jgi:UDP-N-acetyl-D-mannosaminuronic acid dehydrogenase
VVGLGYIGLPTAALLADRGYQVRGVDTRRDVVDTINRGEIHIHEPDLDALVERVVKQGRLTASLRPQPAEVFMICVPTPVTKNRTPDVSYVQQAAQSIRPHVQPGNLVILESTSPPHTTERVVGTHAVPDGLCIGGDVFVAYCPERVLPGRILIELVENDRVVGGVTADCTARAAEFYRSFVAGQVHPTTAVNAEMAKLSENAFRDVNIAFANELSMLAESLGADPLEIIRLANHHPRVNILNPGPGVGGHCISVDPWFLVHAVPEQTPLIRTAREVNDHKPHYVVDKIETAVREHGVTVIGCLGLAYKADVDDLRESPSLEIVRELRRRGLAEVLACDPYVRADAFDEFPLHRLDDVLRRSQLLVLLTDHRQFRALPPAVLQSKHLIDTRGVWGTGLNASLIAENGISRRAA